MKSLFFLFFPMLLLAQSSTKKINGISFYPPVKDQLTVDMIASVKECHVDWVAFIPEATLERETLLLRSEKGNAHFGKTVKGTTKGIALAKSIGLKVMLKPHIELSDPIPVAENKSYLDFFSFGKREKPVSEKDKTRGATWRGDFTTGNEADWETWEESYEAYILEWARLADSLSVDVFCFGTELKIAVMERPFYWRQLIQKIRGIYFGPITYAANWDEYEVVPFWNALDYIGIDAYFPISESKTPTVKELVENWRPISEKLKQLSEKNHRQILITEFGYRNVSYSGLEPWTHNKGKSNANNHAQVNLYEGFFQTFQQESYIAGSFLWQWIYTEMEEGNTSFSPKGKPAMKVLEKWYGGK